MARKKVRGYWEFSSELISSLNIATDFLVKEDYD